ncbi:MAG TPA: peptidoglycan-binding domain-containing protein [Acidimicrobiales bacterium]|nr:peptidoglycan-binding domain-containing protein [Acidimicrobiales bacterium]
MPIPRTARLAPLAAAPASTIPPLDPVDPTDLFEPLRRAVLRPHPQHPPGRLLGRLAAAFPRRGEALAAAGVVVASATLTSLGLLAAAVAQPDAPAELALQPVLIDLGALGAEVAVVPPGNGSPRGRLLGHRAPVPAAPAAVVPEAVAELGGGHSGPAEGLATMPLQRGAPGDQAQHHQVPADAGALPLGRGMWLYLPEEVEGGSVDALVARATQVGLTHVYVRTGSSRQGFYAQAYMDELLPKAHAADIRVYGWDFPYLHDVGADVARAVDAIAYITPSGDRLDGFAADIETASEGTNLTAAGAAAYSEGLRAQVGPAYPLVAVVPRPSPAMQARFPYPSVIPSFDAVAPMTYWLNRQPDSDVVNDVSFLAGFGKPVIPIGQAYDGAPEGGRPGPPPPDEIRRFLSAAQQVGAAGTSFWSWQHASQAIWDTLAAAPEFRWEAKPPAELRSDQIRGLQVQLTKLGFAVPATGAWDGSTTGALRAYQERAGLPPTGHLDASTLLVLHEPFNPPLVRPGG